MQSMKWKEITTEEALLLSDLGVDVFCHVYKDDLSSKLNLGEVARWAETPQRRYIQSRSDTTWYIPDDDD